MIASATAIPPSSNMETQNIVESLHDEYVTSKHS